MNNFEENMADTAARTRSELQIDNVREQGGFFVEAVRLTRMPMIVTDATLPGNPIIFANEAFIRLSGYEAAELTGQEPHFMNGDDTDPEAIACYEAAMREGRDANVEIVQHRKDGSAFRAMLFASPLGDGQGTILHHFLSYLDISRRHEAEEALRALTQELEAKVEARTRELQRANGVLTQLLGEKELLVAEVNHRAKNSLAIASSLLGIQGRRHGDAAVKALFEEARNRLMAMARVHDLLSKSETSQRVRLATYFEDLCDALRPITEDVDGVALVSEVEADILVSADVAIPLGIIATELVTNAVKYAFAADGGGGTIAVKAARAGPGRVEMIVSDDGCGMSAARQGSLGYGLVEALVRQIRGEMDLAGEGGVTVTIGFPAGQAEALTPGAAALSRD